MTERVLAIWNKVRTAIKEWWNKFQPKQKTLIICIGVGILVAIGILIAVLSRKQYVLLTECESTKEAAAVKELLDEQGLDYKVSSDGLTFRILSTNESDARLTLGSNNIVTSAYTLSDVLDGSFSTTEADKQKKYRYYLETQMEEDLECYSAVSKASVQLTIPDDDGTLIAQTKETYVSIILELDSSASFSEELAENIAKFAATAVGNDTTDNITITDTNSKIWFPVEDTYASIENADTMMLLKQEAESLLKQEVKKVLLGTNEFSQVEVATNVKMDFAEKQTTTHTYTPAEGQEQGVLSHEELYKSSTSDSSGGVPGTDSNSETDYLIDDTTTTDATTYERKSDYLPNEQIVTTTEPTGTIVYDTSSLSVAAVKYNILKEEDAQTMGLLADVTWDEYKLANATRTKMELDDDLVSMVANATGIPSSNITIVAYEEMQFIDKAESSVDVKEIIQIVLIILILGMLGFVVFMSLHSKKEIEEEEELAVEDLLQSTQQDELENIELEQKSEARKLIENFVDENPEAVATLLRNWLDEEWG